MRDFKLAMHYYRVYLGRFSWWLLAAVFTVLIFAVTNAAAPMFLGRAITALTNTVQHGQGLTCFIKMPRF
jgi:ABC-type multidrug transport system fused ATPase/permease subunit